MANVILYDPGDATVANRVTSYLTSVNTPDYTSNSLINPDLSGVSGVEQRFWKVSDGTVIEMSVSDKSSMLPGIRIDHKAVLRDSGHALVLQQYPEGQQNAASSLYSDSQRFRPNRSEFLQDFITWVNLVETNVADKVNLVDDKTTIEAVEAITLDTSSLLAADPQIHIEASTEVSDDTSLATFLNENAVVTDTTSGISGPYYLMELLNHRKDLYNDSTNPLYDVSHTPILGSNGMLTDHADKILNLEDIHAKTGWHRQNVQKAEYTRPRDLLIYYGWLNSFNSYVHGWSNEKVSQEMAKYGLCVFGDGIQNPGHGDYANTKVIIPRIKALNPSTQIFGYVTANQNYSDFTGKVDQWGIIGNVDGIFIDEAGYDYGKTRAEFNQMVDYIHDRTSTDLCFANAWNTDHILGTTNDPSYPNSTYNDTSAESNLTENDWILLESFPINTTSYTYAYESKSDWAARGSKMITLRANYGVNFAGVGIIDKDRTDSTNLFNFQYVSGLMWSLESNGSSDTYYGASSAQVPFHVRPDLYRCGKIWTLNASVQNDVNDADVYHRYTEMSRFSLDFSSGDQTSSITTW